MIGLALLVAIIFASPGTSGAPPPSVAFFAAPTLGGGALQREPEKRDVHCRIPLVHYGIPSHGRSAPECTVFA